MLLYHGPRLAGLETEGNIQKENTTETQSIFSEADGKLQLTECPGTVHTVKNAGKFARFTQGSSTI